MRLSPLVTTAALAASLAPLADGLAPGRLGGPLAAQVVTVDEGTFTVSRGSQRIGREDFSIRRTPGAEGAPVMVASATVIYGERRLSPALRANADGMPLAYQVDVQVGAETRERFRGEAGRGRFRATMRTPGGDSSKEYVVTDGALILDDDVFHQYFFLAQRPRGGSVPVVVPQRNVQVTVTVENKGADPVTIAGQSIPATRLVVREQGSGAAAGARDVWVDAQGRVLRVRIADRNIDALRDDPPR